MPRSRRGDPSRLGAQSRRGAEVRRRGDLPGKGRLWTLALTGLIAGVFMAAAALPSSLLVGFGIKAAAGEFEDLPAALRTPPIAQRSDLYANDGITLITSFYDENRVAVPMDAVAPVMRDAMVAAEDIRFYEHPGVDLRSVLRAFVANQRAGGEVRQGASTLTMQYVRNVLKSDPNLTEAERAAATVTSPGRKLREMRYAIAVERGIGKTEILNRYLNIAYFGAGAYGISAASERYFDKAPAHLNLAEAALLAGLVQSPDTDSPIDGDADAAVARRNYVLDQMVRMGVTSAADAARATAAPLALRPTTEPNGCTSMPAGRTDWGFFCDYLVQWWERQPAFGATISERQERLRRGGYHIVSSLDPTVQASALGQALGVYGYDNPRAMPTAVVQPGTGRVLALAVNRHYRLDANPAGQENYPNTVNQLVAGGGAIDGYQAGSTFKMFTMLAALEAGLPLGTTINAPTKLVTQWRHTGPGNCGGFWCPVNANPKWMNGPRTMWNGFGRSVNTYFVELERRIGADKVVAMAQRFGIVLRSEADAALAEDAAGWGAFTLGVAATTPLDLANAYATVAAEGRYCAPLPVAELMDPAGQPVAAAQPSCSQVVRPDVARAATDAARCPVGDRSAFNKCDGGTATSVAGLLGRPVAGKTGSAEQYATETFVAYTPQLAAAAIAANPDDPGDKVGAAVQANVVAAVVRVMATALAGAPKREFTPPGQDLVVGPGRTNF
ncbi:transglycosylase domain-containing protein [Solwaraspora sp. WMMD1047]|uniref:transglycosylase domain-containing protein n=1 Tax=Solwaraspora sp. WMMD1047 TaxID=3016102 RepID=UPI002417E7AD|nr:transglycosylase domain-containing protein [Solwaraspora sp. WMMD1047]MDG4828787.1 transglycosylase domain-containing protein [Solwaraspora sp. WMMD1047]